MYCVDILLFLAKKKKKKEEKEKIQMQILPELKRKSITIFSPGWQDFGVVIFVVPGKSGPQQSWLSTSRYP